MLNMIRIEIRYLRYINYTREENSENHSQRPEVSHLELLCMIKNFLENWIRKKVSSTSFYDRNLTKCCRVSTLLARFFILFYLVFNENPPSVVSVKFLLIFSVLIALLI